MFNKHKNVIPYQTIGLINSITPIVKILSDKNVRRALWIIASKLHGPFVFLIKSYKTTKGLTLLETKEHGYFVIPPNVGLENEPNKIESSKYCKVIDSSDKDFWKACDGYFLQQYQKDKDKIKILGDPKNFLDDGRIIRSIDDYIPSSNSKEMTLVNSDEEDGISKSKTVSILNGREETNVNPAPSGKKSTSKAKRKIDLRLDYIKDQWEIIDSNLDGDQTPLKVSFHNSLGIILLIIISNYYSLPNTVPSKVLYSLAKKLQRKKAGAITLAATRNKIMGATRDDFTKKLPELEFIREHIILKKGKWFFDSSPKGSEFELSIDVFPPLPKNPDGLKSWANHSET